MTLESHRTPYLKVTQLDLRAVAAEFVNFAMIAGDKESYSRLGIQFLIKFPTTEDVHGLYFDVAFVQAVAEWKPAIDIAIEMARAL